MIRKPKKIRKKRGTRTIGYGRISGHLNSGQKGGVGQAGRHKHLWVKTLIENPRYFGKHGFKRPQKLVYHPNTINVGELDEILPKLVERGIATTKGKTYQIDWSKLGYDKLLGAGKVTKSIVITNLYAFSEKAKEKIEAAKGKIIEESE